MEPGTWDSGVNLTYQWRRGNNEIAGATKATYEITAKDLGAKLSVAVTGQKSGYLTTTKTSAKTGAITEGSPITAKPKVSGTTTVGKKLTAKPGDWSSTSTSTRSLPPTTPRTYSRSSQSVASTETQPGPPKMRGTPCATERRRA